MNEKTKGVVPNSDYHKTIDIMHNAQGYRMIGVEYLSEKFPNTDKWGHFHHLIVAIKPKKLVHYSFLVGRNGGDSLYHIEAEDGVSFEDILLTFTKGVCDDGQAMLHIFPM